MSRIFKDRAIDIVSSSRDRNRRGGDYDTLLSLDFFSTSRLYKWGNNRLFVSQIFIALNNGELKITRILSKKGRKFGIITIVHCFTANTTFDSKTRKGGRGTRNNSI
jgi:hypothetical protein